MCESHNVTPTDVDYFLKLQTRKSWARSVNLIGTLVVFLVGFCGNLLSLVVLCRRRLRRNSYTQYLIALAIVDTGAILCEAISSVDGIHQDRSENSTETSFIQHTSLSCKLYYYIRFVFYSMSSWIIVALAIERLLAVRFPLWSKHICTVVNARRILFSVLVFAMSFQAYHFFFKGLDCSRPSRQSASSPNGSCRCKPLRDYARHETILTICVWRLILMTLLPLTIIISVNILIMAKLFSEKSLFDHTHASDDPRRKTVLLYKISRMLVVVSSIYLVLHVPGSSLEVMKATLIPVFGICNMKWLYYITLNSEIFDLLTNFNYGINFYLYVISGKHIRNELVRAFKHAPCRTVKPRANGTFQRSSYMMSSYAHVSRYNQPPHSAVQLSRRPTGSSM